MSKYGSGTSMKTVIELKVAEVTKILDRNGVTGEDKKAVLDALKKMAFHWCENSAVCCGIDALLEEEYPDVRKAIYEGFFRLRNIVYHEKFMEMMKKTLPEWDEEEDDDGPGEKDT